MRTDMNRDRRGTLLQRWAVAVLLAMALGGWPWPGLAAAPVGPSAAPATPLLPILGWHDIRDRLFEQPDAATDLTAVDTRDLIAQFELLRALGYTPIRLQDWLDAREGHAVLPQRPVLLTFDDGYASLYTHVYPLLRLYGFPAVAAIVDRWIDEPGRVPGGGARVDWTQLREMAASGLVEVASHSHDGHHGIPANPRLNLQPALAARRYQGGEPGADDDYETGAERVARIRHDLETSAARIEAALGRRPRALVWPFGAFDDEAAAVATAAGFQVALSLDPGVNRLDADPMRLARTLVESGHSSADVARLLIAEPGDRRGSRAALAGMGTLRTLHVSLDALAGDDDEPPAGGDGTLPMPALGVTSAREARLSLLLERVRRLGVNAVLLDATGDRDGDGVADAAYFPNRSLPVRADLLNRVAWQLRSRVDVKVFAVLPLDALAFGDEPDDAERRRRILALYQDLTAHVRPAGIVMVSSDWDGARDTLARDAAAAAAASVPGLIVGRMRPRRALWPEALRADIAAVQAPGAAFDLVVVPAQAPPIESMRIDRWLRDLIAAAGSRPGGLDHVLFSIDPRRPARLAPRLGLTDALDDARAPEPGRRSDPWQPATVTGPARFDILDALRASRARHYGVDATRATPTAVDVERWRRRLSTATQFNRRP